jgi:hypothetical protein
VANRTNMSSISRIIDGWSLFTFLGGRCAKCVAVICLFTNFFWSEWFSMVG